MTHSLKQKYVHYLLSTVENVTAQKHGVVESEFNMDSIDASGRRDRGVAVIEGKPENSLRLKP